MSRKAIYHWSLSLKGGFPQCSLSLLHCPLILPSSDPPPTNSLTELTQPAPLIATSLLDTHALQAEITSMCMVWSLNLLAVGQEDGSLCVMNSDSGSK